MTQFTDLGLAAPILKALTEEGYVAPTPIQAHAIPVVLTGRDLLGIAQTGTGKTAAFALPILNHLASNPRRVSPRATRVLILSPTRELASQILESFRTYGRHLRLSSTVLLGGVPVNKHVRAVAGGVDVLVATPGRLLDLVGSGSLRLNEVEVFVLDEADQMLDMGFIHAIRQIVGKLPAKRQNLFFSATMPAAIAELAGRILSDPTRVAVAPEATTVERVDQRVIFVETSGKRGLLVDVLSDPAVERALVFTRTKHGADKVARHLDTSGIGAHVIHGNKSQSQRERALEAFRDGRAPVLVATDIAARGIDVECVTHIINYELPNVPETYVHRIGRTARAGAAGVAISFCDAEERAYLRDIEKLTRQRIPGTDRYGNAHVETPDSAAASTRGNARHSGRDAPRNRSDAGASASFRNRRPRQNARSQGSGDMAAMPFMNTGRGRTARQPAR